jgi:hypothetical protein
VSRAIGAGSAWFKQVNPSNLTLEIQNAMQRLNLQKRRCQPQHDTSQEERIAPYHLPVKCHSCFIPDRAIDLYGIRGYLLKKPYAIIKTSQRNNW